MSNIIKFPTWIIEREKELVILEHQIIIDRANIEIEKNRIKLARRSQLSPLIISFIVGMIVMGCILIPFVLT